MNVVDSFNMNKFLNFLFIFSIPCYIWDWYAYIVLKDKCFLIYLALVCFTLYFIGEIPKRIYMYKKFGTIWY